MNELVWIFISALLIKAERTDNPHEADAYLMKAQALATMASIDIAAARARKLADEKPTSPVTRTVSIGDKGKRANTHLISLFVAIAHNNFAIVDVASDSTYVVAYGMPQDLDATHTLFASLSVQMATSAQRYLEKNEWKSDTYRTRSRRTGLPVKKPFTRQTARAAFYRAYVARIDERLQQARETAVRSRDESRGNEPSAALVLRESEAEVRAFHRDNRPHFQIAHRTKLVRYKPRCLGLKARRAEKTASAVDVDEAELAENLELPGADLSSENLTVTVVPKKSDEFTCMSCFLVHHRSQLDHEGKSGPICKDCA